MSPPPGSGAYAPAECPLDQLAARPVPVIGAQAASVARFFSGEWAAFVWSSIPGAALVVAATAGLVPEAVALTLFAVSFVGLNLMHMGATWARVYVRPGWQAYPIERLAVPVTLAAFALSFEAVGGGALLLAAQYFLSFHHALMQNYGLTRAAQRRTERSVDARLDLAACLLLPGAALLYRAGSVSDRYAGAALPSGPSLVIQTMAVAGVLALVAVAWREWRSYRRGERVDPIGIGLLFGTNLLWSALLVGDPHPAMPLYALASGHYVQYLYFVWQREAREPAAGGPVAVQLQSTLRASRLRYLVVLLVLAGTVTVLLTGVASGLRAAAIWMQWRPEGALDMPPWAAAMIGINLEHYWLDRRIWRVRSRPARWLTAPAT